MSLRRPIRAGSSKRLAEALAGALEGRALEHAGAGALGAGGRQERPWTRPPGVVASIVKVTVAAALSV